MKKLEFTKYNSLGVKGIAIIMMMFHHCFRSVYVFKDYYVSFFPFNEDFFVQLSNTFKICVSIFAFITGYGLLISFDSYRKKIKKNRENNLSHKEILKWIVDRLIKTLSGFWIIAVLSYIICQIIDGMTNQVFFQNGILSGLINLIINFLGLSDLFKTPLFNATWWYMSLAIIFILLIPIIVCLYKKYGLWSITMGIIFIPRFFRIYNQYIYFLFPMVLGMVFADKNLLVKFANFKLVGNNILNKLLKFILESILMILLYLLYQQLPVNLFWEIKYGIAVVFFICYLYEFILDLPLLKNILQFLGKHSMNIFLIHDFLRTTYLTDALYSFSNFAKIGLILLLASLLLSIIIELFKKLIRYNKLILKLDYFITRKIDKTIDVM